MYPLFAFAVEVVGEGSLHCLQREFAERNFAGGRVYVLSAGTCKDESDWYSASN